MKPLRLALAVFCIFTASLGLFVAHAFGADAPAGFSRKVLQDQELTAANHHGVVAQIDFAVGAVAGRHTHPGEELGYVIEGTVVLEIDGKPPQTLKAGDSFFIPANVIHTAKNGGNTAARVVSSYVLEKGKPLATAAK